MALSFVGQSVVVATTGAAPTAVTPHASSAAGDLLVFYHYGRGTGGDETCSLTGFTDVFDSVTANQGHLKVAYRVMQAGDTSFTATVTNYTSGVSGETILEWIETYRGQDTTTPIGSFTASLSTWASSLNLGPISAPSSASLADGNWVVVCGGRFENTTAQTVLSGDSLTWTVRVTADTTAGADASCCTQTGANGTGSAQTVTAKTITTTGTAQAGAGRMFVINAAVVVPGLAAVPVVAPGAAAVAAAVF